MRLKISVVLIICLASSFLSSQDGWVHLLEGDVPSRFLQLNGDASFVLDDGVMIGTSKLNTPNSFLATKELYSDFILEFEVHVDNGLNSGVQFRSLSLPSYRDGRVHGYQCEIETSSRKWAGGIYDEARRGWLYPLTRNPRGKHAFVPGEWNHYRIEAIGPYIRTFVNGIQCANLVDDLTPKGLIAFQVHSIHDEALVGKKVRWRNIKIKTSGLQEERMPVQNSAPEISYLTNQLTSAEQRKGWRLLWDGVSTSAWRGAKSDEFPSKGWVSQEGSITVLSTGGLESAAGGDIVTREQFSNFELSLDFKMTEGANSGIKYFVNTETNKGAGSSIGLEFQILDDQNHPDASQGKNGNRTVGSLYDLIRAENFESSRGKNFKGVGQWNNARIVVRDGQVEHWLNHVKVVSFDRWSQTFKALVEKSKYEQWEGFGQAPAGHILLQDHGDEVSFRNIKIREF